MASSKNYIKNSPAIIKKLYYWLVPFHKRYGSTYSQTLNLLEEASTWSYKKAKQYQLEKLRNILIYSSNNVPYYSKLFKKIGFNPYIKELSDIKKIPLLTKDIIINNIDDFISTSFVGKKYKMNTSGTTGKRLSFYGGDDLFKIEAAFIQNAYMSHGTELYNKPSIWIRRYSPKKGDPIFYKDHELNRSYMSPFHLNDETIYDYVNYINKTKVDTLVSYPSTIYYLSLLMLKYNLRLPHVKYLYGASEVCLPQWNSVVYDAFNTHIRMHYGQGEKVAFFHQDNEDDLYRENLLYGLTEYVDSTIVGTGFYNMVTPFIRYKTEDNVELVDNPKLDGAFPKTIKNINGRNGDMLVTDKDSLVPAVNFYSFMSKYNEVDLFQLVQKKATKEVKFYIIKNKKYTNETKTNLLSELKYRLGDVGIKIIETESIPRDKNSSKLKTIKLI